METKPTEKTKAMHSYSALDELDLKRGSRSIVVRLLRRWEARNFKRERQLMSMDLLLLDEKDCLIQGSIHHQRMDRFIAELIEGKVFLIKNFDVVQSGTKYRLTDHKYMIRFTDDTSMVQVSEEEYKIQPEKFRIHSYDKYVKLADKNEELPDAIGFICSIQKPENMTEKKSTKVMLRILLEEGVQVRVTIWDDLAHKFCEDMTQRQANDTVIVVTSINPKLFAGELYLNTTTSSKIYLNASFDIVQAFRERVCVQDQFAVRFEGSVSSISANQCHGIAKILEFISNEQEQEKEFTCKAKITEVLLRNGWSYISCSKCSRKLAKSESSLICNYCKNSKAVGVLRFRIEVVVDDGSDTATFVIFDRDAKKITSQKASDIMTIDDANGNNVEQDQTAPACILDIVGRTFLFQIKVTPYNFRSGYQSFTVSRILDDKSEAETKEPKQKNIVANEEESGGRGATAIQDLKSEGTAVVAKSANIKTETNKRRKVKQEEQKEE